MENGRPSVTRYISCEQGGLLSADIALPENAIGIVVFADRFCGCNQGTEQDYLRCRFYDAGIGAVVPCPPAEPRCPGHGCLPCEERRSIIDTGAAWLIALARWLYNDVQTEGLGIGYIASDGGAAVALLAAADCEASVQAIVSIGGRPDLAGGILESVEVPTLLIVAEHDSEVVAFNEMAYDHLAGEKGFEVLPGVRHHAESAIVVERVSELAVDWFVEHFSLAI